MALAYATSNRGGCHMRARPVVSDLGGVTTEGKVELVKTTQDLVAAIDSSGLCMFANAMFPPEHLAEMIDTACEGGWTLERLCRTGERIWNLEKQFNLAAGFTAADDRLPERVVSEPARGGAASGEVADIASMLADYYAMRGWDANGVPRAETLQRLGL